MVQDSSSAYHELENPTILSETFDRNRIQVPNDLVFSIGRNASAENFVQEAYKDEAPAQGETCQHGFALPTGLLQLDEA